MSSGSPSDKGQPLPLFVYPRNGSYNLPSTSCYSPCCLVTRYGMASCSARRWHTSCSWTYSSGIHALPVWQRVLCS